MTTLILGDRVLDFGLGALDTEATHIYVCRARPTTYLEAITSPATSPDNGYALGSKSFGAGSVFASPFTASPDIGRDVTSFAVSGGSVTATGVALYWAVVDSVNTRLLATGPLTATGSPAGGDLISGQTFTLDAFTIRLPSAAASSSSLVTSGLTHHWPMDDANVSGTTITDTVGGVNGTANGAGVTSAVGPGGAGTARQFDGVNVITMGSNVLPVLSANPATLCAWVYDPDVTAVGADGNEPFYINFSDGAEGTGLCKIPGASPAVWEAPAAVAFPNRAGTGLTSATWQFLSWTWPGGVDPDLTLMYRNGVEVESGNASQGGTAGNNIFGGRATNSRRVASGTRIGRVLVYDRALSQAEILQNYAAL